MKILLSTLLLSTLLATSSVALASSHASEKHAHKMTEKLELNAEQTTALEIYFSEKAKLKEARHEKKKAMKEASKEEKHSGPMHDLMQKEKITVQEVQTVYEKKQLEKRKNREPLLTAFVNFRNLLSVNQRTKGKKQLHRMLNSAIGHKNKNKKH